MRLLFLVLLVLVGLIQYPLWLGKGGWFKVWDLQKQLAAQRETNEGLRARNNALDAEVHDLQSGTGAIEERARSELGMMRDGEIFVQILPQNAAPPAGGAAVAAPAAPGSAAPAAPAAPATRAPTAPSNRTPAPAPVRPAPRH